MIRSLILGSSARHRPFWSCFPWLIAVGSDARDREALHLVTNYGQGLEVLCLVAIVGLYILHSVG